MMYFVPPEDPYRGLGGRGPRRKPNYVYLLAALAQLSPLIAVLIGIAVAMLRFG